MKNDEPFYRSTGFIVAVIFSLALAVGLALARWCPGVLHFHRGWWHWLENKDRV